MVDRELRVIVWNRRSEDLWGLRASEVQGQYLMNLDIGLPTHELLQPIRTCLSDRDARVKVEANALNRRGRNVVCGVTCDPLVRDGSGVDGVILWVEELRAAPSSESLDAAAHPTEL